MKQELLKGYQNFIKENDIDTRTLCMIVHHYISIGEQAAENLTDARIDKIYQSAVEEEKKLKGTNRISLITPEFQQYILKSCQALSKLPSDLRYEIIKENI